MVQDKPIMVEVVSLTFPSKKELQKSVESIQLNSLGIKRRRPCRGMAQAGEHAWCGKYR